MHQSIADVSLREDDGVEVTIAPAFPLDTKYVVHPEPSISGRLAVVELPGEDGEPVGECSFIWAEGMQGRLSEAFTFQGFVTEAVLRGVIPSAAETDLEACNMIRRADGGDALIPY